jgi:hypothetical protein
LVLSLFGFVLHFASVLCITFILAFFIHHLFALYVFAWCFGLL